LNSSTSLGFFVSADEPGSLLMASAVDA